MGLTRQSAGARDPSPLSFPSAVSERHVHADSGIELIPKLLRHGIGKCLIKLLGRYIDYYLSIQHPLFRLGIQFIYKLSQLHRVGTLEQAHVSRIYLTF